MKSEEIAPSIFFFCFFFSCDTPQKSYEDVNAPYVKIISHQTGNKINQVVTIQIKVEDENEISIVELLVNSIVIAEAKKK